MYQKNQGISWRICRFKIQILKFENAKNLESGYKIDVTESVQNAEKHFEKLDEFLNNQGNYWNQVSMIIPVYGVEVYLGECLETVLNQTYENLEIILIDDESPDHFCPEICDQYAQKMKESR